SAVMMHTSVFRALGGFDEDMRAAEDYDLWLRLLLEYRVELLPESLVIRRTGHLGQLSSSIPAIDRFRILALLKLLRRCDLRMSQRNATCDSLIEKCRVYAGGARRRGNTSEACWVATLAAMGDRAWRESSDVALENAIQAMRDKLARHKVCAMASRSGDDEVG